MRPTAVTATGVGEGDDARSPEDARAAFLQRKAARRAAGRAAKRTAVSDDEKAARSDEKAARSAAFYAARRAREYAARRTFRTHTGSGRPQLYATGPGLVLTADEVDAIERRRQELRTAHTRMAAAPPPCTALERWRPIDQRPFWARPEFRALLWPPPPPPPTTTDVVSDDDISDDEAAPDHVLEVSEVPLPRLVDEFSRGEVAEALADLGRSDQPVACAAVVVARSHPAGRAVEAEAEAAPLPRPRKSQRTNIPPRRHLCAEPAQVARTAAHGAAAAAAAAAAAVMMDVNAEVEAATEARPRKSQRSHCPVKRHLCDEPAQVALEPARVPLRLSIPTEKVFRRRSHFCL